MFQRSRQVDAKTAEKYPHMVPIKRGSGTPFWNPPPPRALVLRIPFLLQPEGGAVDEPGVDAHFSEGSPEPVEPQGQTLLAKDRTGTNFLSYRRRF